MNMDRQMLTMIGVIVCLLACMYLYKENQKQRTDFLTFTQRMTAQLNRAPVNEEKRRVVSFKPKEEVEEVLDSEEKSQ